MWKGRLYSSSSHTPNKSFTKGSCAWGAPFENVPIYLELPLGSFSKRTIELSPEMFHISGSSRIIMYQKTCDQYEFWT